MFKIYVDEFEQYLVHYCVGNAMDVALRYAAFGFKIRLTDSADVLLFTA